MKIKNTLIAKMLLIFSALLAPLLVGAQEKYEGPMRFSTYRPCLGNAGFCALRILAKGKIEHDTAEKFIDFLNEESRHEYGLPQKLYVEFDSPGGDLQGGLQLGREIRARKLDTHLNNSYIEENWEGESVLVDDAICASACVFAFAGGISRAISPEAKVGVHQFSGKYQPIGDSRTQIEMTTLANYLDEMGVDRQLLDRAALVPAYSIEWLDQDDVHQYQLDNTSTPSLSAWTIKATEDGLPILEIVQPLNNSRSVFVRMLHAGSRILISIGTINDKTIMDETSLNNFPIGQTPRIDFCTQKHCINATPVENWTRQDQGQTAVIRSLVSIPSSNLQALSTATELKITDNFPMSILDVSLIATLSTKNLSSGINLLLRANNP